MRRLLGLAFLIAPLACGGPTTESAPPTATGGSTTPPGTTSTSTTATTCGPAELCSQSIDDCEATLDQQTCEDWYAGGTANCADMTAYTACNCDCTAYTTCDDYFACGNLCFNDHCN